MRQKRKALIALSLALVLVTGCGKQVHVPHPNQINELDGNAYDALIVAQSTLDEAKAQLAAHKFDARRSAAVEIINAGGAAYDTAHMTWATYRDVLSGLKQGDLTALATQLQSDLFEMRKSVGAVKDLTGGGK